MKTYLEVLSDAAELNKKPHISAAIKLELSDDELALLQEAADMYAEQSNSHKHGVVRGGDKKTKSVKRDKKFYNYPAYKETPNTPTEPLATEARAQSGSAIKVKTGTVIFCEGQQFVFGINTKTGKTECFNLYGMSGISDEAALPFGGG